VGDYTTVDGTENSYLLRVFFQTRPLAWEVGVRRRDLHGRGATGRDDASGRGGTLSADDAPPSFCLYPAGVEAAFSQASQAAIVPFNDPERLGVGAAHFGLRGY
jgi:hypothetical protein